MRQSLLTTGGVTPQPPGPNAAALRAAPGGETLLVRGAPRASCLPHYSIARLRHDHARCLPARLRPDVPRGRQ